MVFGFEVNRDNIYTLYINVYEFCWHQSDPLTNSLNNNSQIKVKVPLPTFFYPNNLSHFPHLFTPIVPLPTSCVTSPPPLPLYAVAMYTLCQSYGAKGMHAFIDYHISGIFYHQMSSACGEESAGVFVRRQYRQSLKKKDLPIKRNKI